MAKVYDVRSSELDKQWRHVPMPDWRKFTDQLVKQIAAKALEMNEEIFFHEYKTDTPIGGGPSILVECSDVMCATIAAMPEVHSIMTVTHLPTTRRVNDSSSIPKPSAPQP